MPDFHFEHNQVLFVMPRIALKMMERIKTMGKAEAFISDGLAFVNDYSTGKSK